MSITNQKLKKMIVKRDEKIQRQRVWDSLSTAEKMEIALPTWNNHVEARDEIASFTTIIGNNLAQVFPETEDQVILPFAEYHGDHAMNWIIVWDIKQKIEILRKNTRFVDLIDWKIKKEKKDEPSKT